LSLLHDFWLKNPLKTIKLKKYVESGEIEVNEKVLEANVMYLVQKGLIMRPNTLSLDTKITIYGIIEIEYKRNTPDIDMRNNILNYLKEIYDIEPDKYVNLFEISKKFGYSTAEIQRNIWYLDQLDYILSRRTLGGYNSAKISAKGIDFLKEPSILEKEIKVMSYSYSLLYEIENLLRIYYETTLRSEFGNDWWEKGVSKNVKNKAIKNKAKENGNYGIIYYTDFEDLKLIPNKCWSLFKDKLISQQSIIGRLNELESIRHKIAHTRLLTNEEIIKLELFNKEIKKLLR